MARNAKVISISLPKSEDRALTALARKEKRSKSELVREALRRYERKLQWERIRDWGRRTAIEFGISSYDDVDRIAGKR
ncbi:ribbon-helix-helix protein, CopG family [Candidatus Berkelbacteria bacterium]|nr:ribbon-helix-helix protein, CopG family [Candidatus Berkelbacteria bacterium]